MIGRVYCVSNADNTIRYIGSTKNSLDRRWSALKASYKIYKARKSASSYYSIFEHFDKHGLASFDISLIREDEFESRRALLAAEQQAIEAADCVNMIRAYLSRDDALMAKRVKNAEYYANNREKAQALARSRVVCSCGKSYNYSGAFNHRKTKFHIKHSSGNL